MWWTQPKLSLIVLGVNAVAIALIASRTDDFSRLGPILAATQIVLLTVYWRAATGLGSRHLDGHTRDVFYRRLWGKNRRWWRVFHDEWTRSPDNIPREGGGSFYQQTLGSSDPARESLYLALSTWEGTRLHWSGGGVLLGLALASSTAGTMLALAFDGDKPASLLAATLMLPVCVSTAPEAFAVLWVRRAILRAGSVERVASLVARESVDLGLRPVHENTERSVFVAVAVACGAPPVIIVVLLGGFKALTLFVLAMIVSFFFFLWAARGLMRLIVGGVPFLRFAGPPEVSVLLDLMHRQRAYLSVSVLMALPMLVVSYSHARNHPWWLINPVPYACLLYILVITFGDRLAGYAGFLSTTHFEDCFRRSMAKMKASAS